MGGSFELDKINVEVFGETISVPKGSTIQEIADIYADRLTLPVMVAKAGNSIKELGQSLYEDTSLEFLDTSTADGMRVYQRSVSFLLIAAANDVFGPEKQIVICHSIKKNTYCEVAGSAITDEELKRLENRMRELVEKDLPFIKRSFNVENAIDLVNGLGMTDKAKVFKYRSNSRINLYQLGDVYDYFYGYMAKSTGCLKWFGLVKEADGFVLMFPSKENPAGIDEYSPLDIISGVFREYTHFAEILGIRTAGDLNQLIAEGSFNENIRIEEALQEKKIASIADMVLNRKSVKIILIAGPSSSGKTTFARRLSVQLRINGMKTRTISLDDYFRNRDEAPLDKDGNPNFESLDFLNIELLNENLRKLLNGETIYAPKYNFITGRSELGNEQISLKEDELIIAEGIHGLNEALTASIASDRKFKIFISALTPLNIDNHNRISTSDNRLLRRIIRDYRTRGSQAARTIGMWPSVLSGEAEYIFPTQREADTVFNSSLIYEFSVLKQYAEPLLFGIEKDSPYYPECKRLIKFLSWFLGAPSDDVPKNSIVREFIGGSCFPV